MRNLFYCIIIVFSTSACAQVASNGSQNILIGINGSPLTLSGGNSIEGSFYYLNEFCVANIATQNGIIYHNVKVKINLQNNSLVFLSEKNEEMVASLDLGRVEYLSSCLGTNKPVIFKAGFPKFNELTSNSLYEVLDSGYITLLKHYDIILMKSQSNGLNPIAANTTYQKAESYYVYNKEKGMLKLNKSLEALISLMSDKKDEIELFISNNKLKMKKQDDLIAIFAFYNKLHLL